MRADGGYEMRCGAAVARRLRNFGQERSGSFAIMMAAVLAVLALSAGFAINIAQLYNVRSGLRQALDAAVTSTARDITTGTIKADEARAWVELFLKANGDTTFMGGDRLVLDKIVVDKTANTVEAWAYVDVDLYFPLFGVSDERRVTGESAAVYSDKKIEVAMMLDVTGSMAKQGKKDKIGDLRKAASNAVTSLLAGQDAKNPRVRVAIVPYAEAVNTGALSDTVFVEKKGGSNIPPAIDEAISASAGAPDTCATERKNADGSADFSDDGPYSERTYTDKKKIKTYLARVNRDDRLEICPKAELIALTADSEKLLDTIEDFKAAGVTAGGIAAQWGYYMLSPNWRDAIKSAGMGSGPANHDKKKVSKVAILMTDGLFNTAFAGVKDGGTPQGSQEKKSSSYAKSICANMKADGIEVFTIGFDLGTGESDAKAVLKDCASPDTSATRHFHEASTGTDLDNAFKDIVRNIERLAITR
jgi:Flp pilus assembly protein TadG